MLQKSGLFKNFFCGRMNRGKPIADAKEAGGAG